MQSDDEFVIPEVTVAYCVRLCDGRYFRMSRNAGAPSMTPDKICTAMCPATETRTFTGTSIGEAVDSDGKRYSGLPRAFVYREHVIPDCSCNGRDPTGLANMDIRSDPTLQRGDIVVTRDGPMVFTGTRRLPHSVNNFVPAADYRGFSGSLRKEMSKMRVAEDPVEGPADALKPITSTVDTRSAEGDTGASRQN